MMKRILLLALVAGLFLPKAVAAPPKTIVCPSCSQDDFEHAVYVLSGPGDTIVLPAGAATWGTASRNNGGTIYIVNNITVIGQGNNTVITLDDSGAVYSQAVIALWAAATFKQIKFVGSNTRPVTLFNISSFNNTTTGVNFTSGFRLTELTYVGGTSDGYFAFINSDITSGLIDHCSITGNAPSAELIFGRGPPDAWQTSSTMGGPDNIFIEDCTFNTYGYVCDANSNARYVIRFNTITGFNKIDGHGLASNSPARSVRHMEIYHNNWTATGFGNWTNIEVRGGTAMIFNNNSVTGWAFLTDYGYQSPWPNFGGYLQTPFNYPIADQIGVGKDPKAPHSEPLYWWGNQQSSAPWPRSFWTTASTTMTTKATGFPIGATNIGVNPIPSDITAGNALAFAGDNFRYLLTVTEYATSQNLNNVSPGLKVALPASNVTITYGAVTNYQQQTGNPTATFTESDVIKANRDFFAQAGFDTATGVSVGTTAQMNALTPSIVGYGFWVTDQGSWRAGYAGTSGRLYTWGGSAWVLQYTPYAYPHPLQSGSTVVAPSSQQVSILVH